MPGLANAPVDTAAQRDPECQALICKKIQEPPILVSCCI